MRFCPFCSAENADELAVCGACGRRLPPLPPRRARNAPPSGVLLPPRVGVAQPPPLRKPGTTSPPPIAASQTAAFAGAPVAGAPAAGASGSAAAASPAGAPAAVAAGAPAAAAPAAAASSATPAAAVAGAAASPAVAGAAAAQVKPAPTTGLPAGAAPSGAAPLQPGVMVTSAGFAPLAAGPAGLRAPAPPPPSPSGTRDTATGLPPAPDDGARGLAVALSPGPAAQRREAPPPEPDPQGLGRRRGDPPGPPRPMPSVLGGPRAVPPGPPPSPASAESTSGTPAAPTPPALPGHAADPPWATGVRGPFGFSRGAETPPVEAPMAPVATDASRRRDDGIEPPPTRIQRPESLVDRPFTPPKVSPVPEIPEPGLIHSARYTIRFARARWQRRGAIRLLGADIKKDTDALDQVLGALGGVARTAKVDGRVFAGENAAINSAEERVAQLTREHNDVDARKVEENSKFVDVERERNTKLAEAERMVDEAQKELAQLEAQRRGLRDRRKELERRQKAYLKAAEDNDRQVGSAELGDARADLRRGAEQHRREAAALEPERQDVDRRLGAIERPIGEATAKLDAAKAELDAAKRSLADAREGHTHRLAELDAEQKRKAREIAQAEGEIARRLVTLGTLVNLNRIEDPQFEELYQRIDRLRGAITARTTEIERLTAEREAYDRGNLARGLAAIGGAILVFIALIVILRAVLR